MPSTLLAASSTGERHRLQDPARALRLAIRNYDEPKVTRLTEWLLNGVPLLWDAQYPLARCRVIRGRAVPGDDGFAFGLDDATGVVSEVRRPDEVPQMSKGDRVVTVDGLPLGEVPLGAAVEPESVVELGLWPRGEMAALRRRLAQRSLDDGVIEVAKLACTGDARNPNPNPNPSPSPSPNPSPNPNPNPTEARLGARGGGGGARGGQAPGGGGGGGGGAAARRVGGGAPQAGRGEP